MFSWDFHEETTTNVPDNQNEPPKWPKNIDIRTTGKHSRYNYVQNYDYMRIKLKSKYVKAICSANMTIVLGYKWERRIGRIYANTFKICINYIFVLE